MTDDEKGKGEIMGMKWYWFSFSFEGTNQGCCNVKAENEKAALQKTIDLGIHPKHDDIESFELDEPELERDKLYSRQEMIDKDYDRANYQIDHQ